MAILPIVSTQVHRTAHKLSSCSSIRGSVQVYLSHASMISIRWCLSIPHRPDGFACPANEDYCAVNLIAHNTVPVVPFAGHVALLVDAFASNGAPFLPFVSHRSSNIHSLSTDNSTTLCCRYTCWAMWTHCVMHKWERERERKKNQREETKQNERNYHMDIAIGWIAV